MATNTYVALDKVTVGTATPSITFSAISSAYTDLVIIVNAKASTVTNTYIRVGNGSVDTGSNYSRTQISGTGSAASSGRNTNQTLFYCDNNSAPDASNFNYLNTIHLMNYSNTTTYKTFLNRPGNAGYGVEAQVGLWRSASAIDTILLGVASGNWAVGSTFSLYGIKSEEAAAKATGGIVTSDANYFYHTFLASGTFTPKQSLTADIFAVGGGAGGGRTGGGGGAGGVVYYPSYSFAVSGYACTVGAGGAGNDVDGQTGSSGGNTSLASLLTAVGGGGGGSYGANGAAGGSGGGGGSFDGGSRTGGASNQGSISGATVYGNAGGSSFNGRFNGGGGGAGAVGANGTSTTAGAGGVGVSAYSSWGLATGTGQNVSGTYYYAGGGGGSASSNSNNGAGGYGGGGAGSGNNPTLGTANTGGGGGGGVGGASPVSGGVAGGSGLIIIRYAKV